MLLDVACQCLSFLGSRDIVYESEEPRQLTHCFFKFFRGAPGDQHCAS